MSIEQDFHAMLMQIEQLAAENAILNYIMTTSSNPRGFEEFYSKGEKQDRFGFMSQTLVQEEQPLMGSVFRRKYGFLG